MENRDVESSYYEEIKDTPIPGHGDYPARITYFGYNDYRGRAPVRQAHGRDRGGWILRQKDTGEVLGSRSGLT